MEKFVPWLFSNNAGILKFPMGFYGNNFPHITGARISFPNKSPINNQNTGAPWFFLIAHLDPSICCTSIRKESPGGKKACWDRFPRSVFLQGVLKRPKKGRNKGTFLVVNWWFGIQIGVPLKNHNPFHFRGSHKSKSAGPRNQQPKNLC